MRMLFKQHCKKKEGSKGIGRSKVRRSRSGAAEHVVSFIISTEAFGSYEQREDRA